MRASDRPIPPTATPFQRRRARRRGANASRWSSALANSAAVAKRVRFALDIAPAWPAEAGVRRWRREVTLDRARREITLSEDYALEACREPVRLHFELASYLASLGMNCLYTGRFKRSV